jgi:hypothetical protein
LRRKDIGRYEIRYLAPFPKTNKMVIIGFSNTFKIYQWENDTFLLEPQYAEYAVALSDSCVLTIQSEKVVLWSLGKEKVMSVTGSARHRIICASLGSNGKIVTAVRIAFNDKYRFVYATFEAGAPKPSLVYQGSEGTAERVVILNDTLAAFSRSFGIQIWDYMTGNLFGKYTIPKSMLNMAPELVPIGREHMIRTYRMYNVEDESDEFVNDLWCWRNDTVTQMVYKNRKTYGVCISDCANTTLLVTTPDNVLLYTTNEGTGAMGAKIYSIWKQNLLCDIIITQ